jgi:hypothetical protein
MGSAARESHRVPDRVRAAIRSAGLEFPMARITVIRLGLGKEVVPFEGNRLHRGHRRTAVTVRRLRPER